MKRFLLGIGIWSFGALSAFAADLPTKAPPPVAPVSNWTGVYIGGDVGGEWTNSSWTTTCLQNPLAIGTVVCPNNFPNRLIQNNPAGFNNSGFRAGVFAGANWQVSSWVVGIEGDVHWADIKKTRAGIPGAEDFTVAGAPGLDSSSIDANADGSLRLRGGFLVIPTVLLYGTGGIAVAHVEATAHCGTAFTVGWCAPNVGVTQSSSENRVGWTVGAGVEAMIVSNWLLRGEYRYADYGSFSSTVLNNGQVDAVTFNTKFRTNTAMIGVAYKFGGPILAKY